MATEREKEASAYLEKHKIFDLMKNLTSMLFFYRPDDPKEFLIEKLKQLKEARDNGQEAPSLLSPSNLDAVFGLVDPANLRHVTFTQYKQALISLGMKDINECPDGVNEDKISYDTFITEGMISLQKGSSTYKQP
ncbi:EF-hand calcium-binding domain-containing protein 10 [Syngnathus typhle]|uniref:EF-hand calcium-binding domain-containing protein 10 n=1 Tax=Syngnathus typhle TaxID=161592 RepID=UPI002A6988C8|nr:EF-hand calcium-binding domain-containing protein 10 [Syngnathus typhle]XP_061138589.1 EF-hand calcium-binding domain-containing protein 10 [Syngnathus typhle]